MRGRTVFVAGGGNSAGQAALHLAKWASRVTDPGPRAVAGRQHVRLPHPPDRRCPERGRLLRRAGRRRLRHRPSRIAGPAGHRLRGAAQRPGRRPVRPHRLPAADAMARRQPSHGTSGGSSSPARTCRPAPATAGPTAARRCRWRPACRGCSLPVTCARDRSTGSPPRSAKARPPFPWYTATCKPPRPYQPPRAGKPPAGRHARDQGLRPAGPGQRAHAHRAQRDRHPARSGGRKWSRS